MDQFVKQDDVVIHDDTKRLAGESFSVAVAVRRRRALRGSHLFYGLGIFCCSNLTWTGEARNILGGMTQC